MGKGASNLFSGLKSIMNLGKMFKGGGGAGWLFGLILLASLFKKKKKPAQAVAIQQNYESPTYSFGGGIATTVSNDNSPIPIVFGKHVVGGNIVNSFISSNSLLGKEELLKLSAGSITHISHDLSSGTSIYKLSAIPECKSIDLQMQIPKDLIYAANDTLGHSPYRNMHKNASVEIYYSITSGSTYVLSNKVPLQNLIPPTGGLNYINMNMFTQSVNIPLANDTERDIYVKIVLVNYTTTVKTITDFFYYTIKEHSILATINDYIKVTGASYNKAVLVMAAGSSNQKLLMDVVLCSGEIRNLRNVYVNDRPVYDYTSDNKRSGVERGTKFRFRPGFDSIVDLNTESTLSVQSTIYNQNDVVVDKLAGTTLTVDTLVGDNKLYVADPDVFASATWFTFDAVRTTKYGGGTVWITGVFADHITVNLNFTSVIQSGTPVYLYIDEPTTYLDFQYTTQGEQIDGLVVGLNASEGLYNTNTETGALLNQDVDLHIRICPATLSTGASATFPLTAVSSTELLYDEDVKLRGAKRAKLWFDQVFTKELIANPNNAEKKYLIEIRKTSDTSFSEYWKNTLQVSYVEELINKELCYNGCAYVGMEITANSKVNGGTPNMRFEVDGALLPQVMHSSIKINTACSTESRIVTEFDTSYATASNFIDVDDNALALSGFTIQHSGKLYSLLDDQNVIFASTPTFGETDYLSRMYNHFYLKDVANPAYTGQWGWQYFKAYFKCDGEWHRRFVKIKQERIPTAPLPPTSPAHYRNVIEIINFSGSLTLPTSYLDLLWLQENNTALPSAPEDMLLYQWSDNPAWTVLYLLCDEDHGAGIPFDLIDLTSFKEAADYYDEHIDNPITSLQGDVIRRCSVNYILDSYTDLRNHLERILTICHGAVYNSNDQIKFLVEREVTEAEVIVSLDEDEDLIELSVSSVPSKDMPNQLAVTFLDENDNYNKRSITIEDASLSKSKGYQSINKQDIDMFGLTNESHVFMEAMRIIKGGRYVKFGIQLKTALSGLPLEIYDVFKLTSTTYGWTDKKFRVINMKISDRLECEIDAIEYFDEIYQIDSEDLINYHEVAHTQLPSLTEAPLPVRNLMIFEEAVRNNSGNIQVNLIGNFTLPEEVVFNASGTSVEFDGRYNNNKTSHVFVTLYHAATATAEYTVVRNQIRFDGSEFRFNGLEIGSYYKVAVESASLANAIGEPVYSSPLQLEGKKLPPLDITAATWERHEFDHARFILGWTPNTTDFDLASYVIRFATSTGSWDSYEYQYASPANKEPRQEFYFSPSLGLNEKNIEFGKTTNTNFQVIIKCLDTSGNYSEDGFALTASATLEPDAPSNVTTTHLNADNDYPFTVTWDKPDTDIINQYLIRVGSATSDWDTAQYGYSVANPTMTLDNGNLSTYLYGVSNLKVLIKARNKENRLSSIVSSTISLTLAPTTEAGGTIELDKNGTIIASMPEAPSNKDFTYYYAKITQYPDPATIGGVSEEFRAYAGSINRRRTIPVAYDDLTFYLHYAARDRYGHMGAYVTTSLLADVVPAHVSATQMSYTLTNTGINLRLPDKSSELSWDCYEFHISSSSGFTPENNSTSTTFLGTARSNQYPVNSFPDDTPLVGASTYYVKVRSRSKYAPDQSTYYSSYSADLEVTTSDATAPVLYVNSTDPSISPINIIIGDEITINYSVTDNGALDRTRGRVYHVDHTASATWTDPIDADSHTFQLFPSATDGQYVIQLTAFDAQGNYANYVTNFTRDTATASAPSAVAISQTNTTGIMVEITAPTETINVKEYVVEYAVNVGAGYSAWAEIRRTNATTFFESLAISGYVKFRAKTTKTHSATLDSDYTESNELLMDTIGPTLKVDYADPNFFADTLLTAATATIHFLATDALSLRVEDPVVYSLDSGVYTTATTLTADGLTAASGTVVLSGLAEGAHTVTLRCYDAVGNTMDTQVYWFEVDTSAPADLDTPTIAVNGRTITISTQEFTRSANVTHVEFQIYNADTDEVVATVRGS